MSTAINFDAATANTFNSNTNVQMVFGSVYGYRCEVEMAVAQFGTITEANREAYVSVATTTVPMNATFRAAIFDALVETYAAAASGEADAIRAAEDDMFADMAAAMMADPDFDMSAFA